MDNIQAEDKLNVKTLQTLTFETAILNGSLPLSISSLLHARKPHVQDLQQAATLCHILKIT